MGNLTLISAKPLLTLTSSRHPRLISTKQCFGLPLLHKPPNGSLFHSKPRSRTVLSAFTTRNSRRIGSNNRASNSRNGDVDLFASTSTAQETTSIGVSPQPYVPPPPSQFGSPLFWIGVGVGSSALFSFGANWLKKIAIQQAMKSMASQMGSQNNQFSNSAFPSGSPFGFPPLSASGPSTFPGFSSQPSTPAGYGVRQQSTARPGTSTTAPSQATSSSPAAASVTMDVSANTPQATESVVNDETETKTEVKQSAFVDISPEETSQTSPFENYGDTSSSTSSAKFAEVLQNGAASNEGASGEWSQGTKKPGGMTVETFEKLMEDPKIQNMILPLMPEEMRDPATFKWMLQNPAYRQQLQDMLDNMGDGPLDTRMMENLKGFDLNSPEVKEQFDQIGLTPEEAMSRIMANPEIAMAFQNPKIQQAIMDCSSNPMNIMKYQNDKEVMNVFNKIQELFPGSPGF